ncbi:MAG TPA: DUF1080 domain-containing protein [Tepidisphaeraceae bacterium]|jgi:hypothetical protein
MKPIHFALLATLVLALTTIKPSHAEDAKPDADGFISLFDGKTLDGWDGNPDLWSVQDGCITGQTTKEHPINPNTFLIYKNDTPGDFELHAMFKLRNHNSGIQYRSKVIDAKKWIVGGYQADMDGNNTYTGICYEERGRGIICPRGKKVTLVEGSAKPVIDGQNADDKEILAAVKKGDWNQYVIIAKGNHLIQKLNGIVTADITDNDPKKASARGVIALQLHAGEPMLVQFKDIKIKKLD